VFPYCLHAVKTGKLPLYDFISGGAGVGKSRLIKVLYQSLVRYFSHIPGAHPDEVSVLLCAPTGKAAFNIGGMTLHSALSLPVSQFGGPLPNLSSDTANTLATKLHALKIIIIDEISMVGAKLLNNVSSRLSGIFKCDTKFGGLSVIAVGDFHQLPPVADRFAFLGVRMRDNHEELAYDVLWQDFRLTELTEIMRQRDDQQFASALAHMAVGQMTDEHVRIFTEREVSVDQVPRDNTVHLFRSNKEVDAFNSDTLDRMPGPEFRSVATDTCQGDATDKVKETFMTYVTSLSVEETCGMPHTLRLKINARYMMRVNVNTPDGLVNGATGTLKYIQSTQHNGVDVPFRLWIEFDDPNVGQTARADHKRVARELRLSESWTPVDIISRVVRRKQGGGNLLLLRKNFPLILAMGITIHKSQGDTYDRVAVHLNPGMSRASVYVACSRAKSANGLYLIGKFQAPKKPAEQDPVQCEMTRLREQRPLQPSLVFLDTHPGNGLKVSFHNVQSLAKHENTTCSDRSFMAADVLCFVETKLKTRAISLPGFELVFSRGCPRQTPVYGMCAYTKPDTHTSLHSYTRTEGTAHVEVGAVRVEKHEATTFIVIVYKAPSTPNRQMFQLLDETFDGLPPEARVVCVGDFNVKRQETAGQTLTNFMANRGLVPLLDIDTATTNQGTQIDQAYANFDATCGTGESMTSYHKPLWIIV